MLMFNFHTAFSLGLIALSLGAAILIWSKSYENMDMRLPKIIGYLVIIISVPNLLCTGYYAAHYKLGGHFDKPYPMMMQSKKMDHNKMLMMMMKNKEMQARAAMMREQAPVTQNQEMMTQNQAGQMQPQMMQNQDGQAPKPMMQGDGMQHQKMPMMNGQMQQQEPMSSTMTPGHMQKTSAN
ncbi:MAG: hypothetical protein ACD_21C00015G0001 [uncultured bacterium]|nr:MAG: hypothetical protein ACD_21C00015G0001 [uncultured bacterium]